MPPAVTKTYGSRSTRRPVAATSSSPPPSDLAPSSPEKPSLKRKRPLVEKLSFHNTQPKQKKPHPSSSSSKGKGTQKKFTQLHFTLDTSILRTCPICQLSYTKGAPDDESLHRSHCARVQRGLEWGKEEEKEAEKAGVEVIASGVKLKNGSKGRIISFRAEVGGKIGAKLSILLDTINLTLSSPPLPPSATQSSKVYLFLLNQSSTSSTPSPSSRREKIVGCVIAQRISTAMAIADPASVSSSGSREEGPLTPSTDLIPVDSSTNLYVHPKPLPTPLGIPRLFVSSTHRRIGIASRLLTAAAQTFILGCPLDPTKGEVAFTQPTGAGKGVLEKWGKGGVRIYEE